MIIVIVLCQSLTIPLRRWLCSAWGCNMDGIEYQHAVRDLVTGGVKLTAKPTPVVPFGDRCYCSLTWEQKTARLKWTVVNEISYGKSIRKYMACSCKN